MDTATDIRVTYQVTEVDYLDAQHAFIQQKLSRKLFYWGMRVWGVLMVLTGLVQLFTKPIPWSSVIPPIFFGSLLLVCVRIGFRRTYRKSALLKGEFVTTFSEAGVDTVGPTASVQRRWSNFGHYFETPNQLVLFEVGGNSFVPIPKRAIAQEDLPKLSSLLRNRLGQPKAR